MIEMMYTYCELVSCVAISWIEPYARLSVNDIGLSCWFYRDRKLYCIILLCITVSLFEEANNTN